MKKTMPRTPTKKAKKSPGPELIRGMTQLRDGVRKSKGIKRFNLETSFDFRGNMDDCYMAPRPNGFYVKYADHVAAIGRTSPSDEAIEKVREFCQKWIDKYRGSALPRERHVRMAYINVIRILNILPAKGVKR